MIIFAFLTVHTFYFHSLSSFSLLIGTTGATVSVACTSGYNGGGTATCGTSGTFYGDFRTTAVVLVVVVVAVVRVNIILKLDNGALRVTIAYRDSTKTKLLIAVHRVKLVLLLRVALVLNFLTVRRMMLPFYVTQIERVQVVSQDQHGKIPHHIQIQSVNLV